MTEWKDIPTDKLHVDPASVSSWNSDPNPQLVDRVRKHGANRLPIVRPHDEGYGVFINMETFVAAREVGLEELTCRVREDLEEDDAKVNELSFLSYTMHEPLPTYRKVEFVLKRYEETDGRKTMWHRVKEVADRLDISRTTVSKYVYVGNLDPTLRARLKKPTARSEDERKLLSELVKEKGFNFRKISMSVASNLGDSPFFLELQEKDLEKAHELATEATEAGQRKVGEILVKWKKMLSNSFEGGEKT